MGFFSSLGKSLVSSLQESGDKRIKAAVNSLRSKDNETLLRIANADNDEYDGITRQAARYLYASDNRGSFEFDNGKKDAMSGISEKFSVRQFL